MIPRSHRPSRTPARRPRRHCGFTLVELLVVVAVVALLVAILLPGLAAARRAGQAAVSLSNLRQQTIIISTYMNENKDVFVNPFDKTRPCPTTSTHWVWVQSRLCNLGWAYGPPYSNAGTEAYGYHWLAHTLYGSEPMTSRQQIIIAPGDSALAQWFVFNRPAQNNLEWIFPSSYWYSPTFWQNPARFAGLNRPDASAANDYFIRRNRGNEVQHPSRKVLLFESRDYLQPRKPMWFEGSARARASFVDGSASEMVTSDIWAESRQGLIPAPSGTWNPSIAEMSGYLEYGPRQGFDWTTGGLAYFWATRDGIKGWDVATRR
ncbi:MAG: prepilin-type N-terminal cleavage/methylation domain-containing protein [Phycisphaerales bacterium]|jgi:prepilin-type N-terminal cleavage/methylation domain-containing protein|nr:prepilin-type N-terminal cleavage/methylation domain-containing protein [Phycisphaeraceae bacterium]